MNISVFGTGYVGLVQGAILANAGHHVLCIDVDSAKIEQLKNGSIPIYEPGLEELVSSTQASGHLNFTTNAVEGVLHGDVQFIAVGTPPDEDGSADLRYVLAVAETIASHMNGYRVIINKSTVPVGTADLVEDKVRSVLDSRGVAHEFDIVSNPEFLKEGAAVSDCLHPDRIIIGTNSSRAEKILREIYKSFNNNQDKIIVMNVRSSELTKYAANCMLATKISFINEIANLAERLGADIESVRLGIGSDPRIGYHFIHPGLGYGGSCFPKDVQALIHTAENLNFDAKMLKAVEARNYEQKNSLFKKIYHYFNGDLQGKMFAIWGLAFKPNTDDIREAPSRVLIEALLKAGAKIQAYDPVASKEFKQLYPIRMDLEFMNTKEAVLSDAVALIIVTEWEEFRVPDFDLVKSRLDQPVIFDGRNLYDLSMMDKIGFTYHSIGRNTILSQNNMEKKSFDFETI
jgi:UDPglucose 6-dehydrogenase